VDAEEFFARGIAGRHPHQALFETRLAQPTPASLQTLGALGMTDTRVVRVEEGVVVEADPQNASFRAFSTSFALVRFVIMRARNVAGDARETRVQSQRNAPAQLKATLRTRGLDAPSHPWAACRFQ